MWIHIDDKKPTIGQHVWYYFGTLNNPIHEGYYDQNDEFNILIGCKPGTMSNIFYGKSGYLTDDVTHWMPFEDSITKPSKPKDKLNIHYSIYRTKGKYVLVKNYDQNPRLSAYQHMKCDKRKHLITKYAKYVCSLRTIDHNYALNVLKYYNDKKINKR